MAKIKYISFDGTETTVEADNCLSIMSAAINNGVPGIVAECHGACCCSTCHVYVDPEWYALLAEPTDHEMDMLEFAIEPRETSRLGCQIKITDDLDGLIVHTPESQI